MKDAAYWEKRALDAEKRLEAAKSILWMAAEYAEAGGSHGPEMRDYEEACEIIYEGEV